MIKIIVNDSYEYNLSYWSVANFYCYSAITVQTDDLSTIKSVFKDIKKIKVVNEEVVEFESTSFSTYSEIALVNDVYIEDDKEFKDGLRIVLTKANIVDEVQKLQEQVNPTVDINAMTLDECKKYVMGLVGSDCRSDIYTGADVEISTGVKHFSYKDDDQRNLASVMTIVIASNGEIPYIPYHPDSESCSLIPSSDIVKMYANLQYVLTEKTTRCNQINMYIRSLESKDDVLKCKYDMTLPEEYEAKINDILVVAQSIRDGILQKYITG